MTADDTGFIGRPLPRVEDPPLLRGEGCYTDDWQLPPGQVAAFAAFVRSPHPHARVGAIHIRAAANAPGVLAVLTGAEYLADGCLGQVHGGAVQGLGQALVERVVFDPENAQLLSGSFLDYALLRASSLPGLTTTLTEDPTASNPLRIKGGGESGITPAAAAVVNAAVDALRPLGVEDLGMPLSPMRIFEAIARAQRPPSSPVRRG